MKTIVFIILWALALILCKTIIAADLTCLNTDGMICMYYEYMPPTIGPAAAGESPYLDRDYTIQNISAELQGLTLLPNLANDKYISRDSVTWHFSLSEPAYVYVGFHIEFATMGMIDSLSWLWLIFSQAL